MRPVSQDFCAVAYLLTLAGPMPILAAEADPILQTFFLANLRLHQCLIKGRHCLAQNHVGSALMNQLYLGLMKILQFITAYIVIPPVFAAVCQICAKRPNASQAQRIHSSRMFFLIPPFFSGFEKKSYCSADCIFGSLPAESPFHESIHRSLIGAGYPTVGSGTEIVFVDFLYQFWLLKQHLCRPQAVVQVAAHLFQGAGH